MKEDNISQLGGYEAPFYEQQCRHGSCYIVLFKFKLFDQLIPPKLPQILDIYSVVALQKRFSMHIKGKFKREQGQLKAYIGLEKA